MNWHKKQVSDLLRTDPIQGVSFIQELNMAWSNFTLSEDDWDHFDIQMSQLRLKNKDFFDTFYQNLMLYLNTTGKTLKIFNWLNEHLKMYKLMHQGRNKKTVHFFGSARTLENDKAYQEVKNLTKYLVERFRKEKKIELVIGTGGGPGQMQAANQGARESGALSLGLKIELKFESEFNPYIDIGTIHDRFDTRIPSFQDIGSSVVLTKGGFGTYQEGWSYISLWALQKEPLIDLIFYNQDGFFDPFLKWVDEVLVNQYGYITPEVRSRMIVANTDAEVYEHLSKTLKPKKLKKDSNYATIRDLLMPYWHRFKEMPNQNLQNSKDGYLSLMRNIYQNIQPEEKELKGAINSLVKHTINARKNVSHRKNIENAHHAINEIIFTELQLRKLENNKALTFITPRGKISPAAQNDLNQLQNSVSALARPLTFNHHDAMVHEILKHVPNHQANNQIRIIEPTTPNLPPSPRPVRNHMYLPLKRLFNLKTALIFQSKAMIFTIPTPDGMDLLYELLCLIQCGKIKDDKYVQIVLFGKEWQSLKENVYMKSLLAQGTISEKDLDIPLYFTDAQKMVEYLNSLP